MRPLRPAAIGLLFVGMASNAGAQIIHTKRGYLFQIKYKKGQVMKHFISMSASGSSVKTDTQIITRCLGVDKNGTATLEVTVPAGKGQPPNVRKSRIDKHGRPIGNVVDGFSGNLMWPDKPLKVGEFWKGDMNMGAPGQPIDQLKSTYKFVGFKTSNGVKLALVSAYIDATGQYAIAGTGTIQIRVSDGQLHAATFNLGMRQFNDNGESTVLKLYMTIRSQG